MLESTAAIKLMQGLWDIEAGRMEPARWALRAVRENYGILTDLQALEGKLQAAKNTGGSYQ